MTALTALLESAETWWTTGPGAPGSSVIRYGRTGRTFHLSALLGLAGVRDLDQGRKDIQQTAPHTFYDGGGVGDLWRRWAPFGMAWGLAPDHGRQALTAAGVIDPESIYTAAIALPGLVDDDMSRAAAPIVRQCILSQSTALRGDTFDLVVKMDALAISASWPKSKSERRRAIRSAFRTLVEDHSGAGVKVAAVLATAEEAQQAKRAASQSTRRKAEQEQALKAGADPVGQAFSVLAKWLADGMPEAHLPTPLPAIGKGKTKQTATRRNVLVNLAKLAPAAVDKLDKAAEREAV